MPDSEDQKLTNKPIQGHVLYLLLRLKSTRLNLTNRDEAARSLWVDYMKH